MIRTVIQVENLSKRYNLGVLGHQSLRKEIQSCWARFRGKDDPNTCVIGSRARDTVVSDDLLWALKDVSFEVNQGEVVGIIGRNGAGKSTLLKILSRVTTPTQGVIRLKGHVASLLEVGTGFHPELTGRENIFLNGTIMGMRHREIEQRFDEIVAFAEVEKFIDTPVKRYSSGMYVRLAFSVAAHLEQEILIVDEVLAVGDIQFQRKCLGKMGSVAKSGRTVLFVSHNLGAVRTLCSRSLLFEGGVLAFDGEVENGLSSYERTCGVMDGIVADAHFEGPLADLITFKRMMCTQDGIAVTVLDPRSEFIIEVQGCSKSYFPAVELKISLFYEGIHVTSCFDTDHATFLREGIFTSQFKMPADTFLPGRYTIGIGAVSSNEEWLWCSDVTSLHFADSMTEMSKDRKRGVLLISYDARRSQ